MLRKNILIALVLILIAGLVLGCSSEKPQANDKEGAEAQEEIVLKGVTAWPKIEKSNAGFFALQEKVNEMGKGKVRIEYLGGSEVVPTMELINATKDGTVDIGWMSAGYTVSNVPAANAIKLSKFTPQEERENGVYDLYNEMFHEQANAHLLGRGMPGVEFHLYTTKDVKSINDLAGMSIRVTASYKDFATDLKASPVMIPPGDVYTALERGVADAYGWTEHGIVDWGWEELTKNVIDPGFYQVDTFGLMNLDKWNSLPDDVKEILINAAIEVEKEMPAYYEELFQKDRELLAEKGIEVVSLNDKEAKQYVDMAYEAVWNEVLKTAPKYGEKVKELLTQ